MTPFQWRKVEDSLPEIGRLVEVTRDDGTVTRLTYEGNLWFVPDGSSYVYYTPVMWQYA